MKDMMHEITIVLTKTFNISEIITCYLVYISTFSLSR